MKTSLAQHKFVPGASRGPRRAATLLAQMADLERGDRIKALRDGLHLTQPVVADRVGVTLRGYQEWEAGGGIQWENAKRLAKALRTSPDYIMSGEPQATPDTLRALEPTSLAHLDQIVARLERIEELVQDIRDLNVHGFAAIESLIADTQTGEAPRRRRQG